MPTSSSGERAVELDAQVGRNQSHRRRRRAYILQQSSCHQPPTHSHDKQAALYWTAELCRAASRASAFIVFIKHVAAELPRPSSTETASAARARAAVRHAEQRGLYFARAELVLLRLLYARRDTVDARAPEELCRQRQLKSFDEVRISAKFGRRMMRAFLTKASLRDHQARFEARAGRR